MLARMVARVIPTVAQEGRVRPMSRVTDHRAYCGLVCTLVRLRDLATSGGGVLSTARGLEIGLAGVVVLSVLGSGTARVIGSGVVGALGSFPSVTGCPTSLIKEAGVAQQIFPPPISAINKNDSCADSGSLLSVGV